MSLLFYKSLQDQGMIQSNITLHCRDRVVEWPIKGNLIWDVSSCYLFCSNSVIIPYSIQNFQFQIWAKGEQTSTYSGKEHLFILMGIKSYYSQNTFTVLEFSNFVKTVLKIFGNEKIIKAPKEFKLSSYHINRLCFAVK